MAFMTPNYDHGTFALITNRRGESTLVPARYENILEGETVEYVDGWFCQLSASGYTDQTDWSGPFETEQEAREYIADHYDVDPDTGDELTDEDEDE